MNLIIIEDEKQAQLELKHMVEKIIPQPHILSYIETVEQGLDYFSKPHNAQVILSDVQLTDGCSFEIFEKRNVKAPVIFVTGYNDFRLSAFEHNGIDYLLKPLQQEDLKKSLEKYKELENHFLYNQDSLKKLLSYFKVKKTRIIVKRGFENICLPIDDIVFFYTENKVVYVFDNKGKKYMIDKTLGEIEEELGDQSFFRANRQYIIHIKYVKSFKSYEKVKLQVDMEFKIGEHTIIVSQETAPAFRKWVYDA